MDPWSELPVFGLTIQLCFNFILPKSPTYKNKFHTGLGERIEKQLQNSYQTQSMHKIHSYGGEWGNKYLSTKKNKKKREGGNKMKRVSTIKVVVVPLKKFNPPRVENECQVI